MTARVIPPITGGSPTITEAMLTSATLPETPPAAYNAGTTYAAGATVSVSAAGNAFDVYESLQAGNTGNTPASSPLWWKLLGRTYGVYSGATAYSADDRVIDPATHLEYLALVGSTGAALTDETKWQLQGYTNRWRAFDTLRNTTASGPSGTTFVLTPGKRIDAIGLAGMVADSFTLTLKVGGVTKWTYSEALASRKTLTWSDYFFGTFTYRSVSAVFDIPKYSGAELTITFERENGDIEVGAIWIGSAVYLGDLETEPNLDRRNFSTIDRSTDGSVVLIQRRTIPQQRWLCWLPKTHLPRATGLVEQLNAVPALWAGLEDTANEYFEPLLIVGIYTRFQITPGHPDVRIDLELEET